MVNIYIYILYYECACIVYDIPRSDTQKFKITFSWIVHIHTRYYFDSHICECVYSSSNNNNAYDEGSTDAKHTHTHMHTTQSLKDHSTYTYHSNEIEIDEKQKHSSYYLTTTNKYYWK